MISIVNYGLGNIQAFANIYNRLHIPVTIANTSGDLAEAEKIILPGVGAFDWAMTCLDASGMREELDSLVLKKKKPILGVCVGMQIMAKQSDEGKLEGLGWIDGEVKKFKETGENTKLQLPHMGWNDVVPITKEKSLFNSMSDHALFYFLHSYHFLPHEAAQAVAMTDYNGPFVSAVCCGNVFGVQFHPEKSHHWGVQLLKNFAELEIC